MGTTPRHTEDTRHLELVQSRIVTDDVARMATFYAALVGADVVVNDYYVEVPTTAQRIGLARMRFSDLEGGCGPPPGVGAGAVILDFAAEDVDDEHARIDALGVEWLMGPTLQPWGRRSMMLRDPEGHLVNVFEKKEGES
jgi:predicted enzyme related to lactoylglutathione lyase